MAAGQLLPHVSDSGPTVYFAQPCAMMTAMSVATQGPVTSLQIDEGLRLMRRMVRRRIPPQKHIAAPDLEELADEVGVAAWLPSDKLYFNDRSRTLGTGIGPQWFAPDGRALSLDVHTAMKQWGRYRMDPANHLRSRSFYRSSVRIYVSTVYLGIDHSFALYDSPPIIWETMIFIGGHGGAQWRYATRPAAVVGHRTVVAEVAAIQRRRRREQTALPPRRPR